MADTSSFALISAVHRIGVVEDHEAVVMDLEAMLINDLIRNIRDRWARRWAGGYSARIRTMPDSDAQPTEPIAVGSRVTVIPISRPQSGRTEPEVGVVVEDFADTAIEDTDLGRDWAPVKRWAIALDDGRLVFASEGGLELA